MIKITADSTCDLTPGILKSLDITLMPLYIVAGDKTYRDGVDITPEDIFRYAEQEGNMCKTAAANVYDYERLFDEFSPKYDAVIHINIGSHFSSSYQNACLAAQNFPNVHVIDSQNLSTGSGHLVLEAALMAKEGLQAEEICRRLEEMIPKLDSSFVIDKLDYLHKGGRCSGLEAFGARLLQIKPCIEVIGGQMKVGKKYRGSFGRSLEHYVKDRLGDPADIDLKRIFITHSKCSGEVVAKVREMIQSCAKFEEIIETDAGCTISCHCGPNTLGILYKRKNNKTSVIR